ncbi:MAG TPA: hypothetical protein VMC79_16835 [Rectinemataceae bacterium]|nr:hypothetical protein [Rectinemataceae bacterium]
MIRGTAAADSAARFMDAVRSVSRATAQSRLLNTKDRDVAAVLQAAADEDRIEVLTLVGPAKAERLRGEIERMRHVRLGAETIATIAEHLCAHIVGERPLGSASRYFRPHRPSQEP